MIQSACTHLRLEAEPLLADVQRAQRRGRHRRKRGRGLRQRLRRRGGRLQGAGRGAVPKWATPHPSRRAAPARSAGAAVPPVRPQNARFAHLRPAPAPHAGFPPLQAPGPAEGLAARCRLPLAQGGQPHLAGGRHAAGRPSAARCKGPGAAGAQLPQAGEQRRGLAASHDLESRRPRLPDGLPR